jgi:hypothetical protein
MLSLHHSRPKYTNIDLAAINFRCRPACTKSFSVARPPDTNQAVIENRRYAIKVFSTVRKLPKCEMAVGSRWTLKLLNVFGFFP